MKYDELKALVTGKGFHWFEGELNLNFIWRRTSDTFTNYFTDFLSIGYTENGINQVLEIPCTTKPGLNGAGAILNPPTVNGVTGTDVICGDQQCLGTWQFVDEPTGKHYPFDKEFFRQIKPINYYRDGQKVLTITSTGAHNSIDGTQWHKMSNPGAKGFPVNNWSEGCMGAQEPDFISILPLVRRSIAKYGNIFTGTIINNF